MLQGDVARPAGVAGRVDVWLVGSDVRDHCALCGRLSGGLGRNSVTSLRMGKQRTGILVVPVPPESHRMPYDGHVVLPADGALAAKTESAVSSGSVSH